MYKTLEWCIILSNDGSIVAMMYKIKWYMKFLNYASYIYSMYTSFTHVYIEKIYSTWEWCFLLHNYLWYIRWSWNDTFVSMIQIILGQKLLLYINMYLPSCASNIEWCMDVLYNWGDVYSFDDEECSRTPQPGLVYNCGTLSLTS